ncbi:MAG: tryptophan synthase subunit alpha [Oscillospiraceae bacterium]|nr:tryptophan synthase subunit alpha [Oscillospiraceae bacterium]
MTQRAKKGVGRAFKEGKTAFVAFVTGGDPDIETSERLIETIAQYADIIEIGIPFSDPVAEGPIIQEADERSLAAGCTVDKLFAMVKRLREKLTLPLLFMTYANPIFVYGSEKFMKNCAEIGIDGVIVPDLPFEEKDELSGLCKTYGIEQISLIAPTSGERIAKIASEAEGFLYCVSSTGVTGTRSTIGNAAEDMIAQAKRATNLPCCVGFGISTPQQAREMAKFADGVIVGSAIVKIVAEHGRDCIGAVEEFVRDVGNSLDTKGNFSLIA